MKNLKILINNTFNCEITKEVAELFDPVILDRIESMITSLRISKIPFKDEEFKPIYEHQDYNYLRMFILLYKDIKDLKLPAKND